MIYVASPIQPAVLYDLAPGCCISQSIRKGNKKCCLHGCLAFCLVAEERGFYGWLLSPGVKANI